MTLRAKDVHCPLCNDWHPEFLDGCPKHPKPVVHLTAIEKLRAIEWKYYNSADPNNGWKPKKGDYYTLTRQSTFGLELFQITDETDTQFGIMKLWDEQNNPPYEVPAYFDKAGFTNLGFGLNRVFLSPHVYKPR